jgi:large subunit ribosomal protein L30
LDSREREKFTGVLPVKSLFPAGRRFRFCRETTFPHLEAMKSEGSARSKRRRARFRGPSFRPRPREGIAPRAEFSRRRYMLYVTLRRGLAGKQQTYIQTLKSLGLHKVRQEVQVANNEAVRGQIDKVKHLVSVETAAQRDARLATEAKKLAPKEPLVVNH